MMTRSDVIIVGGGLSGLSLANMLFEHGVDYTLIEARDRLGGRILSLPVSQKSGLEDRYDLGPSWFWPGQPWMEKILEKLNLDWFEQAADGKLVYEDTDGSIQRDLDFSTMQGARRIVGGAQRLIEELYNKLDPEQIQLNSKLQTLNATSEGVMAGFLCQGQPQTVLAGKVVICAPPRLAADTVNFDPVLDETFRQSLLSVPTWMAGHAKFVAVYDRPFWHAAGLSGDGISRIGPLMEIHDASPKSMHEGALFGFVGLSADQRQGRADIVKKEAIAQLTKMFGSKAASPKMVLYEDWAKEDFTSTSLDSVGLQFHPQYGPVADSGETWGSKVIFGSTETASQFGGLLEGALEAAENVFRQIINET